MDSLSYRTVSVNRPDSDPKWLVVDAAGIPLGRLASIVAYHLRGKHKTCFTPHSDCGDYVIVINAERVHLSGRKWQQKMYVRHTGYPGGQRHTAAQDMRAKHPERMIEIAVRGMLPKTKLGDKIYTHLKVFTGPEHKHQAQSPTPITPHVF